MATREAITLVRLIANHPDLEPLRQTTAGLRLLDGGCALALHLFGVRLDDSLGDPWLVELLHAFAPTDMEILAEICLGNRLNTVASTIAILLHLAALLDQDDDGGASSGSCDGDGGEGEGGEGGLEEGEGQGASGGDPNGDDDENDAEDSDADDEDEDARRLVTPEMMDRAMESMAHMNALEESLGSMMPNMGWGLAAGHLQRAMTDDLTRLVELMRRLPQLREIADMLGRLEEQVRRQRHADRGGREAVVGVRFGRELADVLPGELALLGEPATEDLFYQRYTEHRLLCLELEGAAEGESAEGTRRGPIVACVDTSGSMSGWREVMAKALMLAVVRMALPQRRPVRLMLFGGPGDFRDMDIRPGPAGAKALLDFLSMSFHAGTDYDGPLARAMELLDTDDYERADILIVTDGYCHAGHDTVERVQRARAERGFRVVSVITEGHPHAVRDFSDHVWLLERDAQGEVDLSGWDPEQLG